ncbi:MAG TPA: hypothetical protein VGI81_10715 [Tepidisphaeraceae bacterium]
MRNVKGVFEAIHFFAAIALAIAVAVLMDHYAPGARWRKGAAIAVAEWPPWILFCRVMAKSRR